MKETPFSKIEKNFLKNALLERKRLDGRHFDERRPVQINFGKEYGCCHVTLGDTRVLAQVSSEIQQPTATRPNEGLVFVNVEFSPMAAQHVETGKPTEACVVVNRVLEKCIRESKCIDLESLCIIAEEKVWVLRVDLTVLNIEGNVVECSSIAALAALAHFRRPDVTSTGDRIIIHDASEKEPLPTSLHHFPVCLTYAIFNKGSHIIADPTLIEEETAEASLNVGMNAYRELCGIHLGGKALSDYNSVLKVVQRAGAAAAEIVQFIKQSLADDEKARANNEGIGLSACIRAGKITTLCDQRMKVKMNARSIQEAAEKLVSERHQNKHIRWDDDGNEQESVISHKVIIPICENTAELLDEDEDMEDVSENETVRKENEEDSDDPEDIKTQQKQSPEAKKSKQKKKKKMKGKAKALKLKTEVSVIDDSDEDGDLVVVQELTKEEKERMKNVETLVLDDSEEEETSTLTAGDIETPAVKSRSTTPPSSKKKRKKNKNKQDDSADDLSRQWYPKAKNAW